LDYLRRDPINSGVTELGDFDYSRIITNITPVRLSLRDDLKLDIDNDFYVPGFDRRAISSLTDYFHDHMRHYRRLVNHHNVVRTDLALTRLIIRLADIFKNKEDTVTGKYLREQNFQKLWDWSHLSRDYRYIDDAWLDTLLQGLYKQLLVPKLAEEEYDCRTFLEVLYDRKMENMIPIWKRIDDFMPFAFGFKKAFYLRHQDAPLGFITNNAELQKLDFMDDNESATIYSTNLIFSFWKKSQETSHYSVMEMVETKLNSHNTNTNVVFTLKTLTPYKTVFVVLDENKKIKLDKISSIVAGLNETSDKEVKLFAFEMRKHEIPNRSFWDSEAREELGKKVGNALFDVIKEGDEIKN
jgi:HD superfamily phosphohydrolase